MIFYDFKLSTGDLNVGTVYLPKENAKNLPVIIYCHGWGGRRQLWTPTQMLCNRAMEKGIALVTFDFFGCGETGGDHSKMTYTRWKENLSDIVSWVESQPFSDKEKIGCYAFSSGSTAALRLAAEDERLAFVISIGTCISSHIFMRTGGPSKWLADNLETLMSGGAVKDFGLEFLVDTISGAPIHSMDKIACPVLFLQGTADNTFRCADAKMAFDLMSSVNPTLPTYIPLKDGTHELDNMADEAMAIVYGWLTTILGLA
ncbi:MAG: alpha/beta fold hydrolase [Oscillospiraceae bacterium]|nr:alpha/beta fold hydrolase [Oscillospiraceae bacterium]